ncbi:related to heterokaryon incompatibility protein (het-6OR allele) [Fusarium fujikuroi]|nr:related to heterokaryon incompatibility protein (het-6OR allele) [Fusarium fujikuroi]
MDKIFREADHVLCWLGRDDNNVAEDCFRFIRHTRIAMEREFQPEWTMDNLISDTKLVGVSKTAREWDFVAQLFEISWFQRVWIVQEAALARACYLCWGIHQVHFYEALSIASWLAYSIHAPSLRKGARVGKLISDVFIDIMHTFDNRPTWRDMILFDKILEDLHPAKKQLYVDLLFCARSLRVTDQRDVIYSSLGSPLAHSVNGEVMVAPDYTEPWKQQQIRAAKALLRNPREGPHVLSMIVHDSMAELLDDGIPSWNTLPIESVWLQLLEKTSIPPEELIGQFSLTLARGRPASDDHVDDLLLYCERLRTKAGTETTSPFPPKVSTSEVLSIAERSLPRSRDRRLAMTTQGRMALVPLIAEANDVCCIVQGMDVPMVFRKATNGTYKCLGETYCSGVMEGELLGPECTNEPEWTELHIR